MKQLMIGYLALAAAMPVFAKLTVVTTISDLRSIASQVGGDQVSVTSIAKGTQDPHYIEAKPSFMVKVNQADLVISVGLDLEVGWLPSIIRGARNPKLNVGEKGYLEVGPLVKPLEVPTGNVTRAEGDVHPFGNPHVTLDPIRAGEIAVHIGERLATLDPAHAEMFRKNGKTVQARLVGKAKGWQTRIDQTGIKKVITYHKTLTYFLDRFHLENPAILEPKPGIPPTSGHIIEVIKWIREQKIPLILVENYFDPTVTTKIKQEVPAIRSVTVPVAVDGAIGIDLIDDIYENLVKSVEGKS